MRPFFIATLLCAAMSGAVHAAASDNLCEGLVTSTERFRVAPVAKPPFMRYYKDPAFGTRVIRITQTSEGEIMKPPYSSMQAWNADESLLLLYRGGKNSGHELYDGKTYKPFKKLDIRPSDLEEIYWSHSDPDIFYYVSKASEDYGIFNQYSVKAGKPTPIRGFSEICGPRGLPTGGKDVQMQSLDDDLFGFRCSPGNDKYIMFTYRMSTGEVVQTPLSEAAGWEDWTAPIPGPSGDRLWQQGKVLDLDLETVTLKQDMSNFSEHANIGQTHDGQDAVFQVVFNPSPNGCNEDMWQGVGHLVVHNMETGECRSVINEAKGYPYTTSGTHASSQAYKNPGWIAMSSVGYGSFDFFTKERKATTLFSEIYLANTDPDNEVVCRLAHHRSFGKSATRGGYAAYFGEPHATISPSGTRIIFGSDWYDSGSVDSYVIELPAYYR